MGIKIPATEKRMFQQLKEHYEIEKELATRLRISRKEDRKHLYTSLYDELFARVPHHPQLMRKSHAEQSRKRTAQQIRFLRTAQQIRFLGRFLDPEAIFLELGPGDCSLAAAVAQHVRKVYAIDVSKKITEQLSLPENVELLISDGCSVPIRESSVTIAYSNQLMEHLHPEDAIEQLQNIYKALRPDGIYICITPNRLAGPHDISRYFDSVATGFHLKEYTNTELIELFSRVGFSKIDLYMNGERASTLVALKLYERLLNTLPHVLRRGIITRLSVVALSQVVIVGTKLGCHK